MPFMKIRKLWEIFKGEFSLKHHINLIRNDNGSVLIIVAFLMIAIFGMTALVVDAGMLYREKNILQKTVDAAALAGVQELEGKKNDTNNAETIANQYVIDNYDGLKQNDFPAVPTWEHVVDQDLNNKYRIPDIIEIDYGYTDDYNQIKVTADIDANLWFAKVISDKWKLPLNVSATATAYKAPGYGPMPIGLYKDTWITYYPSKIILGDEILVRKTGQDLYGEITGKNFSVDNIPGWFDLAGLDSNKSNITDYVSEGIPGCLGVGDTLFQLQGGSYGNVQPGIVKRTERADSGVCFKHPGPAGCPKDPYHIINVDGSGYVNSIDVTGDGVYNANDVYEMYKTCPRLLLIPILSSSNDKKVFTIDEFIILYLEDTPNEVAGWFLGELMDEGKCLSSGRYARLIR